MALQCPTRLEYALNKEQYHDTQPADPLMMGLAEGSSLVDELAKLHFPNGRHCTERSLDEAALQTQKWITDGETVIFDAALKAGHKFIRVDILELTPKEIRIIEVKAKSLDGHDPLQFWGKRGGVAHGWIPYIEDVLFQTTVAQEYFESIGETRPIHGYLMAPNRHAEATHSKIHTHFRLEDDCNTGRPRLFVQAGTTLEQIGRQFLIAINLSKVIDWFWENPPTQYLNITSSTYGEHIAHLERTIAAQEHGRPIPFTKLSEACARCPFQTPRQLPYLGKISGFRRCFEHHLQWEQSEFDRKKIWETPAHRYNQNLINQGIWFADQMPHNPQKKDSHEETQEPLIGKPLNTKQRAKIHINTPRPLLTQNHKNITLPLLHALWRKGRTVSHQRVIHSATKSKSAFKTKITNILINNHLENQQYSDASTWFLKLPVSESNQSVKDTLRKWATEAPQSTIEYLAPNIAVNQMEEKEIIKYFLQNATNSVELEKLVKRVVRNNPEDSIAQALAVGFDAENAEQKQEIDELANQDLGHSDVTEFLTSEYVIDFIGKSGEKKLNRLIQGESQESLTRLIASAFLIQLGILDPELRSDFLQGDRQ